MKKGPKPRAFKVCPGCKIEKARAEFYGKLATISHLCKPCSLQDTKNRKHLYRGKYSHLQKAWRQRKYRIDPAYRARIAANKKRCYEKRKEEINAKRRLIWATDPLCSARKHNRWHDVKNRRPSWADLDAIVAFYAACPEHCEVDHIVPLRGLIDGCKVSGLHVLWNLQYLPREENRRKYNRISMATLDSLS